MNAISPCIDLEAGIRQTASTLDKVGSGLQAKVKAGLRVDAETHHDTRKTWWLCVWGQTAGERSAGRTRLSEIATRFGTDVDALVAACGLSASVLEQAQE
ncbi:hypothetical protein [Siccirubricoccus sp. G192]|uniref:hypothetical protein n=1 Tax=Siccirubricoccus sp. G192 TaxID=2849651 RepID=UPI001C2BEE69|nr:hypothetical protein [Siccirubricoccus sp. G192]MBV1798442.1 hypothetical protein [Siccirubricoccus sp. G192]